MIDKSGHKQAFACKDSFPAFKVCQTNQIVALIRQKIVSIWMLLSIIMKRLPRQLQF
jgi:hypothetical protein